MNKETETCQNCRQNFVIEPEDFKFYEKIKVPPPTWCPECRMMRRMNYRNERALYRRKCSLCQEDIISVYHQGVTFPVYCNKCWWSDKWSAADYVGDYDFSKNFYLQFKELLNKVPRLSLFASNNENSPYTNYTWFCKNCYLSPSTLHCEDVAFSIWADKSYRCIDCAKISECQLCYENINTEKCYNSIFLIKSQNCIDSAFLFDCHNCKNCFMSSNLRNKSYVIENKQYPKEEYFKRLEEYNFGSYIKLLELKNRFAELIKSSLHKFANVLKSTNSTGENILNAKKARKCFDVYNVEDIAYCFRVWSMKDSMDLYGSGPDSELFYEGINLGIKSSRQNFCMNEWEGGYEQEYCDFCMGSSYVFGCVGLRKKQYCILNKQYTKEEYEKLVPRIIEHMNQMPYTDKKGRVYKYGEFFPPELSPFAYNETIAQEYFPLTKSEALAKGYSWKDPEPRNYQIQIPNDQLPDHIKDVKDDIVGQVIECAHAVGPDEGRANGSSSETSGQTAGAVCNEQCTEAYKIIPQELAFLKKMNLPLPRLCPNCRHYQRIKQRNPLKLWHRKCQCAGETSENKVYQNTADHIHHSKTEHCQNEFETTYAPERPEIVYCEACYLREVV